MRRTATKRGRSRGHSFAGDTAIVYKNLPSYPTDMLRTLTSSEFNGVILNDPVRMKSDDLGGAVPVPRASVLSIIW